MAWLNVDRFSGCEEKIIPSMLWCKRISHFALDGKKLSRKEFSHRRMAEYVISSLVFTVAATSQQ